VREHDDPAVRVLTELLQNQFLCVVDLPVQFRCLCQGLSEVADSRISEERRGALLLGAGRVLHTLEGFA